VALPTFFIIGAPKAGTTSLHFYLEQHPQIQMSSVKEPHFFAGPEDGIPYAMGRVDSQEKYEKLFDEAVAVRGEASPTYSVHPRRRGVPERIKALVPEARFIYMVRDPVARTVSHYQHRVALEGEQRSLSQALGDLADPYCPYTCPSRYAAQLEEYLEHFPRERVLVLDQDELLKDRKATLRRIFGFLGVEESFDRARFEEELLKSSERHTYPAWFARLVERVIVPLTQWIPARTRRRLRRTGERRLLRPLPTPTLDDDLRERLRSLFAEDAARLRTLTGKEFPTWSV
jgi:hypothetical protein